ncbi:helix-turn-helix transcriptional regulator [Amycolatopsis sp. NPDC051716]|uniref:helix-turn-helix domain-containing protein n=1 Tax=Amycolatopsis sp. NPDC051716 TaxID=3155804 RepID=UPI00342F9955
MSDGMSLTGLAESVHFTKGYLSKAENGKVRANRDLPVACDRALGAGGELLALIPESAFPARRSAGGIAGLPDTGRYFAGRETELEALSALLLGRPTPGSAWCTGGRAPARRHWPSPPPGGSRTPPRTAASSRRPDRGRTRKVVITLRGIALASVVLGRFADTSAPAGTKPRAVTGGRPKWPTTREASASGPAR